MGFLRTVFCLSCCCGYLVDSYVAAGYKRPYFDSRNLHNVLRWDPKEAVQDLDRDLVVGLALEKNPLHLGGEPVLYSVMYQSDVDEEPFWSKTECQNITSLSCDLTAETACPYKFYSAQLHTGGRLVANTYHFRPIADTILGPPKLSTRVSGPLLHLNVTLPLGPGDISLLQLLTQTRCSTPDPVVMYTLTITYPSWAAQVNDSSSGHYVLQLKNNNTEYCGYVVYKPTAPNSRLSENASFCVLMPRGRGAAVPWVLMAGGLVLVPAVLASAFMYRYTHPRNNPHLPPSLQVAAPRGRWLRPADQTLVCCVPAVSPLQPPPKPRDAGGYAPQGGGPCADPPAQEHGRTSSSSSSSGRGEEEEEGHTSSAAQSSVSYGHVVVKVPGNVDGNGPLQGGVGDGEGGDSGGVTASPALTPRASLYNDPGDNPAGPLVLSAVRNPQGELMLSLLAFQSQVSGGEEDQEEEQEKQEEQEEQRLLADAGYKAQGLPPLLLSLSSMGGSEDWDSACNQSTTNTPTQLSVDPERSLTRPADPEGSLTRPADPANPQSAASASGYEWNWFSAGESTSAYGFGHWPWTPPGGGTRSRDLLQGWIL